MPPTARDTFERTIRPAKLFVYLHELLEDDERPTPEELIKLVSAHLDVPRAKPSSRSATRPSSASSAQRWRRARRPERRRARQSASANRGGVLFRHGDVLLDLLTSTLPDVIEVCGMGFLDATDDLLLNTLSGLLASSFKTKDVLSNLACPPEKSATWLGRAHPRSGSRRLHQGDGACGWLAGSLGLADPWAQIEARHPGLDRPAEQMDELVKRRKEIVHRGDTPALAPA